MDDLACVETASGAGYSRGSTIPVEYTVDEGRAWIERQWARQEDGQVGTTGYGVGRSTEEDTPLALVKCPECSRSVSEFAKTCPNCGHPLKVSEGTDTEQGEPVKQTAGALHLTALKIVMACAVAIVLGSFLPWATMSEPLVGSVSIGGMEGDGVFTLMSGALVGAIALLAHGRGLASTTQTWLLLFGSLIVSVSGVYDFVNMRSVVALASSDLPTASVGIGLYLVVAGGIGSLLASFGVLRTRRDRISQS